MPRKPVLQHWLHCILLICHGKTCADVAALFDDALRTVQHWVRRFNDEGIDGLRDSGRPGRQSRLSKEEREILTRDLRVSPREFEYMQNLWDGKLLSYHYVSFLELFERYVF
ncbi:MAG: helix-turn-helix domain-containing protein [Candidatus Brocadiaceae bacterium]|nr:helix-turn-helix domain-containing protein [Candidatus Brocadiaceae bacterium]